MSANQLRGEVCFTCGAIEHKMRPTFDTLAKIEHVVGKGFFKFIADGASTSSVTLPQLRDIVVAGIEGAGGTITPAAAGDLIMRYGLINFMNGPYTEFLNRAAGFNETLPEPTTPGE